MPTMSQLEGAREAADSWELLGQGGLAQEIQVSRRRPWRCVLCLGPACPGNTKSCLLCRSSLHAWLLLDAKGTHHHASGTQRVGGSLEVVPADAVDLAQMLASLVVDAVEV